MPRSRLLLSLSIASALVMLLALTGWCGGPVSSARGAADAQQPGNFGGQTAGGEGGGTSGFSVSGGVGSASANGTDGTSPYVNFEDVGIKSSQILQTWDWRAIYQLPGIGYGNSFARITGQWTYIYFKASQGTYTGPTHPFLVSGQALESKLTLNVLALHGDFFLTDLSNWWGDASAIRIGPRVQWVQYGDRFKLSNEALNLDQSRSRSFSMFGAGLVGEIDLAKLVGMRWGFAGPQNARFNPVLGLMYTYGGGGSMRYDSWEVALKMLTTPIMSSVWGYAAPTLSANVGVMGYRFKQTLDRDSAVSSVPGSSTRSSAADFRLTIPFGSATVTF